MTLNTTLLTSNVLLMRFLLLLLVTYPISLSSQSADLEGDILVLPVIVVEDAFYDALFRLDTSRNPYTLELIDAYEIRPATTTGASSFNNKVLFIADIEVGSSSYWIKFQLKGETAFELKDYGLNDYGISRNPIGQSEAPAWQRLPGEATDIGIGADGSTWVVGNDERNGGFGIYHWTGSVWTRVSGAAVRIDVDPSGNPWIVNDQHELYRYQDGNWLAMPGEARDIGIGANGAVWVVSGGGIYRWNGFYWDRVSGSATRIDVDPAGNPWVIDSTNDVYRLDHGDWIRLPGAARDIGIGADGSTWLIGTSDDDGNHGIYRWLGDHWNQVDGSARHVSVDPQGKPWVVNSDDKIYRAP